MRVENIVGIVSKLESEKRLMRTLSKVQKFKKKGWSYKFLNDGSDFYVTSPNDKVYSRGYFFKPSKKGMPLKKEEILAIHYINKIDQYYERQADYYDRYFMDFSDIELTEIDGFFTISKN